MERPVRKPNRLREYDYSQPGCYFVTICTKERRPLFWAEDVPDTSVGADIVQSYYRNWGWLWSTPF